MIEGVIIVVIAAAALFYSGTVSTKTFFDEENGYLLSLKEKDYNFLVGARYGENVNPNKLFMTRIRNAFYTTLLIIVFLIGNLSFLYFIVSLVFGYVVFKMPYIQLQGHYKKYMAQVDLLLPYYLKNLEILCQNYTVPVALARSIDSAPEVFKPGLRTMIAKIDAGDSSIIPYMDFAQEYPVRDSMRMMRLLYRLGLGAQENKYKQLLMFSKSVSSLQNKAREVKYKQRLGVMESKTMVMLVVTGGGTMLVLVMSMMMGFGG
jgi:hypothetical protein